MTQVVAADGSLEELLSAVREEVARLDPELVVHRPATMAEVVDRGASRERFALVLMGAFAVVALALAALGLYGVLAYAVRQRSTEIGIRIALGATAGQVRALVFRQAAVVVSLGVAAGLAGALVLGRWLEALAFGIAPSDPRILIASAVVLSLVALVAAWLPAQRAWWPRLRRHRSPRRHYKTRPFGGFQSYIRVDTINPPGNEAAGVQFFKAILDAEGISLRDGRIGARARQHLGAARGRRSAGADAPAPHGRGARQQGLVAHRSALRRDQGRICLRPRCARHEVERDPAPGGIRGAPPIEDER